MGAGQLVETSKAASGLDPRLLGTTGKRLDLDPRTLGISLKDSNEFGVGSSEPKRWGKKLGVGSETPDEGEKVDS